VGKSSLLNRLLREERAIVTPIPGTTRDTIEEQIVLEGYPVRLVDTAGITQSEDVVEQVGIKRTRRVISTAHIILLMLDGSQPLTTDDFNLLQEMERLNPPQLLVVVNKIDLPQQIDLQPVKKHLPRTATVFISAKTGQGLDNLRRRLALCLGTPKHPLTEGVLVTNVRHHQALSAARQALEQVQTALHQGLSLEFVALDLKEALDHLGQIVGQTTPEEVLEQIFSRFCIGK